MKQMREESITSPSKKGKAVGSLKGKEVVLPPKAKKMAKPRDATSTKVIPMLKSEEGTSVNPATILGP